MEFRILGPLEVSHGGAPVKVGGLRQRTVLAMLLLEPDRVISVDRLVDAVWGDEPPHTAREQIQICVSNLRRVIAAADGANLIETRSPGYVLRLTGCTLDTRVFDAKVHEAHKALARREPAAAAASLRDALSLWRGEALSSIPSALVQQSVTHLMERRLSVLEECITIELNAGLRQDLVGELTALVQEHPLNERFRALLMTALHRAGRQAEALESYRRARATLQDQLGIEPDRALQQLHEAILCGKSLMNPAASMITSTSQPPPAPRAPQPPQQPQRVIPILLPAITPGFNGRSKLIGQVLAAIAQACDAGKALPIIVFYGQGSAGKPPAPSASPQARRRLPERTHPAPRQPLRMFSAPRRGTAGTRWRSRPS